MFEDGGDGFGFGAVEGLQMLYTVVEDAGEDGVGRWNEVSLFEVIKKGTAEFLLSGFFENTEDGADELPFVGVQIAEQIGLDGIWKLEICNV